MWDLIVSVPDQCLSFYIAVKIIIFAGIIVTRLCNISALIAA